MRALVVTLVAVFSLAAVGSLEAQSRGGRRGAAGIPPGQLPPAGECRVWYDGRPPGQQPPPTNCDDAERIASRDRNARVIYGDDYRGGNGRWKQNRRDRDERDIYWENDDRRDRDRDNERAVPRRGTSTYPYPSTYPGRSRDGYPNGRGTYGYESAAYDNGYRDGLEKGREDARDRDSYDPVRHSRYRSADRGYNSRYGSKDDYKLEYRDGFEAGYRDGYRR